MRLALGALAGLLALVLVGVFVLTMTDLGRERVRLFSVGQLADRVNGEVRIGRIRGNLLTGATLEDVEITDHEGRPFLRADTLSLEYSIRSLFQKHLVFTDVRAVHAVIVLDQPPGERWNIERLFPDDSLTAGGDTIPGFGDWVRIEGLTVVDGTLAVLREWEAPDEGEGGIAGGLIPPEREWIVSAPGGQQSAAYFYDVNGHLPLLRLADPDSAARIVQIGSLSTVAMPFRPPPVRVRNLSGQLTIWEDTLGFDGLEVTLPNTQLTLDGFYAFGQPSGLALEVDADTVSLADLRWLRPSLPEGGGKLALEVVQSKNGTRVAARDTDVTIAGGRVQGFAEVTTGDEGTRVEESDLRFTDVDTRTVEELAGEVVPFDGVVSGEVRLAGGAGDLDLAGWASIRERGGATSLVEARGGVLNRAGGIVAQGLALRFDPLRMTLAREIAPDVPLNGSLTGTATLDGPLDGLFRVDADLVHAGPGTGRSYITARGAVAGADGGTARGLSLRFDPLTTELARVFVPDLPVGGTIRGTALVSGTLDSSLDVDADLVHVSEATGRSHVLAEGGLSVRDGVAARGLELRFDPLTTALARVFVPELTVGGTITGRALVTGELDSRIDVDADLVHESAETGRSHVLADGGLLLGDAPAARALAVRMDPLTVDLARSFGLDLPIDGTLRGRATLDGVLAERISATDLDVVHEGSTGTSSLAGRATLALADGISAFDLDLVTRPLSLATVGRFAPALGLTGSASGRLVASGTPASATVDANLEIAGGGSLAGTGTVGFGADATYDLRTSLVAFDASAVTTRGPATTLSGSLTVRGMGTDPATANAFLDAALVDSRLEGTPRLDSTRVTAYLADGLATFERGHLRLASATADVQGSFGLVEGRSGELRYSLAVDSLSQFDGFVPEATGVVPPRPLPHALALARARALSAQAEEDSLVASLATGRQPPPPLPLDTAPPLPRDSVSGGLVAEGVLTGNLNRFDAEGTAELREVVAGGASLGSGRLRYLVANAPGEDPSVTLEGELEGVQVAGFAFASATIDLQHTGGRAAGSGRLDLELFQDPARDYRLLAEYRLDVDRKELLLEEVALRFDSTRWTSTGPGAVRWSGGAIELETIELTTDQGGRVYADGIIPDGGPGELRLEVDSLQVAQLAVLLQDTVNTHGLLSLDATVRGTTRFPVLEGTVALDSLSRAGYALPDLAGDFRYQDNQLTGEARALEDGRPLLIADLSLPLDLALKDRAGPVLLDGPLSLDLVADSLPLAGLPTFIEAVQDPTGVLSGEIAVRGTLSDPELSGEMLLVGGSLVIPDAGLTLQEMAGAFRLAGDLVYVDSLVALSDGGPIRADGIVGIETLTEPELDLEVTAREALVMNNERGKVRANVGVDVEGPLDALVMVGDVHVEDGEISVPEADQHRRTTRLDDPLVLGVLDTLGIDAPLTPGMKILENMRADLEVRIERDTWLRNSDLNLEVFTPTDGQPLRVSTAQGARTLVLEGVIHTDRGEYDFAGRSLKISTGSVSFLGLDHPDPLLQLSAQHEVPRPGRQTLMILINVGGYLSRPRLSLSSNSEPPLPESDLLSYLAFGRESGSLLASEGSGILGDAIGGLGVLAEQQLAGLFVGALSDALFSTIEEDITEKGVDVFRVRPTALPDELNFGGNLDNFLQGIEIEAGEYWGPFYVATTVRPILQSAPGLWAEYRTASGFSWTTAWQPRYLPLDPTLEPVIARPTRVLSTFFLWQKRF